MKTWTLNAYMLLKIAVICAVPLLIAGCSPLPPKPPKMHCLDAKQCTVIKSTLHNACGWGAESPPVNSGKWGTVGGVDGLTQWRVYNFHSSRDIAAVIEVKVETQLPESPQVSYKAAPLKAQPKDGNVVGGPDDIDYGGPYGYLGCEWVMQPDKTLVRYTYRVVDACFTDDTINCPNGQPPHQKPVERPPVENELLRCQAACDSGDPSKCRAFDTSGIPNVPDALDRMSRQLRTQSIPMTVDMGPLLKTIAYAGGGVCPDRRLIIDSASRAEAFGEACQFFLAAPPNTPAEDLTLRLRVPSTISGEFSRGSGPIVLAKVQWNLTNSAYVEHYTNGAQGGITDVEPIAAMAVGLREVLFAGERNFCARVKFPAG